MTVRCLMTATTGTERRQWGTATNPTEMDRWHACSRRRLCRRGEAMRCWRRQSTWWPRCREGVGNYEKVQVRGTVAKKKRAVGLISTCQNIANRNVTVGYGWRGRQFHYNEGDGNVIETGRVLHPWSYLGARAFLYFDSVSICTTGPLNRAYRTYPAVATI